MSIPHLSLQDARHLQLAAQGLLTPRRGKAAPADLLATIRRMALLQIDTISVVARSPYLVLFSRLGQYDPRWLEQLLADGEIFEYWAHEACFVPREDYRLLRHRMLDPAAMGWKFSANWLATHQQEIGEIIERIRQHGPVRAADFERKEGKGNGWWDWKPEKRHLEVLFTAGQLMVRERRNFQRVYDLAERVMPEWRDERDLPSLEQAQRDMVRASCRALGLVKTGWVADYYRLRRGKYDALLHQLADEGELLPVRVEGGSTAPLCTPRWQMSWPRLSPAFSRPATPRRCRRLTRWCGIANGPASCSSSTIASSATPRRPSVSTATSCCRCCIVASWWAEWTPRPIASRGSSRSRASIWRRGSG